LTTIATYKLHAGVYSYSLPRKVNKKFCDTRLLVNV